MKRIIRVTGTGRLSLTPDEINLAITLTDTLTTYQAAVEQSAQATGQLKHAFEAIGFKKENLKTTHFSIDSKYEGIHDPAGAYRQEFAGYEYDHQLLLAFDADSSRLGQVLTAFVDSGVSAEFKIVYTVKDPESATNELLEKAVRDAKAKAERLAGAAGVSLGDLVHIDYAWQDISFRNESFRSARFTDQVAYKGSFDLDVEPENIKLEKTVRVAWEIK